MHSLTRAHYRLQVALRAQAVRDAHRLWRTFDPRARMGWKRLLELTEPLVVARHRTSSGLGAAYFERLALAETGGREQARLALPLPPEQIYASLTATGLVGTLNAMKAGKSVDAALVNGFVRFQGGLSRLVLSGGRDTILRSATVSKRASGWERVTGGNPCSFCSGLAGGHSSEDAFPAHDNCSCSAAPTF